MGRGTYKNALMVYECYTQTEEHTALTQCKILIEIKCI